MSRHVPQRIVEPRSSRAASLPPAERRASIIAATIPLVLAHGSAITTRQIAEAAGIAEGTIFRVFPDKDALLAAVVEAAMDPAPVERAIGAIDPSLPFEDRLAEAVRIMQRRLRKIWKLSEAVTGVPAPSKPPVKRATTFAALAAIFASDAARVAQPPEIAAQMLRALTLAMTHPSIAPERAMSPRDIVGLLLDGIRSHQDHTC